MAPITRTDYYLTRLGRLVGPAKVLETHGFSTRQLTEEELLAKRRCSGRDQPMARLLRRRRQPLNGTGQLDLSDETHEAIPLLHLNPHGLEEIESPAASSPETALPRSKYRVGVCVERVGTSLRTFTGIRQYSWLSKRRTCCNKTATAEPCVGSRKHPPHKQELQDLISLYSCHPTPLSPPEPSDLRDVVALDCEIGTAASGELEIIRIKLVDYFSETILIDSFVDPDVPMAHLNTRYSRVSWADIDNARRQGTILTGKAEARRAIWKYVGPNTLVIGHGASNDLRSLRWMHMLVVDACVAAFCGMKLKEAEAATKKSEDGKRKWKRRAKGCFLWVVQSEVLTTRRISQVWVWV